MQKKYLYGSLITFLGIIGLWQLAANAQTFSGPKPGCDYPYQTNCNVDGVVWNRSNFDTADVQPGNYKLGGSAQIGGDFYFSNNLKALRIDRQGATSTVNIGNWHPNNIAGQYAAELNVYGNINAITVPKNPNPQITAYSIKGTNNLCIGADCRTTWPSGGGGGGGTVTSVGSGNGLTGGPITGAGSLSIIGCTNGEVLKANDSNQWACGTDVDTNSGGTISTINSPGGIVITNPSGPITSISPDYTILDGRYVKKTGDVMSGSLTINSSLLVTGSGSFSTNLDTGGITRLAYSDVWGDYLLRLYPIGSGGQYIKSIGAWGHTGSFDASGNITSAGQVKGTSLCIGTDCRAAWPAAGTGDVTDVNAGTGITVTNPTGPAPSVALASSYQLPQSCANGQVAKSNGSGAWTCQADAVGSGTITGVTAGTGLTGGGTSGTVTLNVTDNYVNTTGDWMTGALQFNIGPTAINAKSTNTNVAAGTFENIGTGGRGVSGNGTSIGVVGSGLHGVEGNSNSTNGYGGYFTGNTNGTTGIYAAGWKNAGDFYNALNVGNNVRIGTNSYSVDADGPIKTDGYLEFDATTKQKINLYNTTYGIGVQSYTLYQRSDDSFAWFKGGVHNNTQFNAGTGGSKLMQLNGSAQLMVGPGTSNGYYMMSRTSASTKQWAMSGDDNGMYFSFYNGSAWYTRGTINSGTGAYSASSDARLKTNIQPMTDALSKLMELEAYTFDWKKPDAHGGEDALHAGFIAQQVEKVFPNWITEVEPSDQEKAYLDGDKQKMIGIGQDFDAMVVESIKELKFQNDMLQAENNALLKRIEAIEAKLK